MKNCIFDLLCFHYIDREELEGDICMLAAVQRNLCRTCSNCCSKCMCYVEAEVWDRCSEDILVLCIEEWSGYSMRMTES